MAPSIRPAGAAVLSCVLIAALESGPAAGRGGPTAEPLSQRARTTAAVVDAARGYLRQYRDALRYVLADERTEQVQYRADRRVAARTLTGEFFLTFLEADRRWMAIHDVATVDGARVDDGGDLVRLLRDAPVRDVGARLAARNARFNLGGIRRNFNEPTLALLVLEPDRRDRVRFSLARADDGDAGADPSLVTLRFEERGRPTIVSSMRGGPVPARGELVVEAATGAVRRTTMAFDEDPVIARLVTDYARDPRLDLWLPVRFSERYERRAGDDSESVVVESAYSNYRRFETDGRLGVE